MPRSVLFVDHSGALGGAQFSLLQVLERRDRGRFTPQLVAHGRLADAGRACGARVHEVALARLRGESAAPWRLLRGVYELTAIIRRERIATVCSNSMRASIYAAVAALATRRPHVWHVRDMLHRGVYTHALGASCAAAIAVSRAAAEVLPCTKKTHVIHNGVNLDAFQAVSREMTGALRATWGVPPDAVLVGHVARLQSWKGQRDVIAAAEIVLQVMPDVHFAIIGGDIFGDASTYEAELKAMVAERSLSSRVVFTGHQEDVATTMAALDIVVHASREEPFGRVLIEAGAAGRPVVAYASGGVREIVIDGQTGLLVNAGEPAALAAGVERLVHDPALAHALGTQARTHVSKCFDIRETTRRLEEVLAVV